MGMSQAEYRQMGVEADVVLRLGMLLMGAGTSGYRVMRGMKRAARAMGFDRLDLSVGVTQIVCTFHRGEHFRTIIAQQHSPAVDASRIEALEDLTHHGVPWGITAEELTAKLDAIEHGVTKRWNVWILSTAAAVACASFAVLNYFSWVAIALVALAAFCGQFTRHTLAKQHVHQLGGIIAAGLVSSLVFLPPRNPSPRRGSRTPRGSPPATLLRCSSSSRASRCFPRSLI